MTEKRKKGFKHLNLARKQITCIHMNRKSLHETHSPYMVHFSIPPQFGRLIPLFFSVSALTTSPGPQIERLPISYSAV